MDAQWRWFNKQMNRKPSALLNRKNEFADPLLLEIFVNKARKENVPIRTPVWSWQANYAAQSYVHQSGVKSTNNVYVGLLDWKGRFGYDLEQDIDKLISDINNSKGEINELLVFPGFVDRELFSQSSLNWQRGQFLKIIQQGKLTTALKKNFEIISFKNIK